MCGCGKKASTSVAAKTGRTMVYVLTLPDGTKQEFSKESEAYTARSSKGGKVRPKIK